MDTNYSSFLDFLSSAKKLLDVKGSPCSLHNYWLIIFCERGLQQCAISVLLSDQNLTKSEAPQSFLHRMNNFVHLHCLLET